MVDSRIDRALLWMVRILLAVLGVLALLRAEWLNALWLFGALAVHLAGHVALSRLAARGDASAASFAADLVPYRKLLATLLDLALAGAVFYLTGGAEGGSSLLGFVWAASLAARLSLWPAISA
ncbi:MAG: hypothetical protein P8129_04245, partial [Anaerolineae bacterium]